MRTTIETGIQRTGNRSTMRRIAMAFALALVIGTGVGCANGSGAGGSGGGGGAAQAEASPYGDPPAGSALAGIEVGMNDTQVRNALGNPDNSNAYMTGKAWIPFYYGPDTHRTDWMYRGQGRVVFSRNRYSGGLKVIRVLYNPNELK